MPDTNRVVFVVDDEAVITQTSAVILNQAGFQASAFDHPEKAIAASAELTPAPHQQCFGDHQVQVALPDGGWLRVSVDTR